MMTASLLPLITLPSPAISHLVKHDRRTERQTTHCEPQPQSQHTPDIPAVANGVVTDRRPAAAGNVRLSTAPRVDGKPLIPDLWTYNWHALAIRREFRGRVWSGTWAL